MQAIVRVTGRVPVRIRVKSSYTFECPIEKNDRIKLSFQDWQVPPREDGLYGPGVDDRLGTYVKSVTIVDFPLGRMTPEKANQINLTRYVEQALAITNTFIEAYRYVTADQTVARILAFEHYDAKLLDENCRPLPLITAEEGMVFRPYGIALRGTVAEEGHRRIQEVLDGRKRIELSRMLLVDAKAHRDRWDFCHAVFDIATALEVHIEAFLSRHKPNKLEERIYRQYDDVLKDITGKSLYDEPDLSFALEYIRNVRNNIAHEGQCKFTIKYLNRKSKHYDEFLQMGEHRIHSPRQVNQMRESAIAILHFVDRLEALTFPP